MEGYNWGEGGGEKELERTHNPREIWGYRENQKIHENLENHVIRGIRRYHKKISKLVKILKSWTSEKFGDTQKKSQYSWKFGKAGHPRNSGVPRKSEYSWTSGKTGNARNSRVPWECGNSWKSGKTKHPRNSINSWNSKKSEHISKGNRGTFEEEIRQRPF